MKALLLALSQEFPMWEECLKHNLKLADVVFIRLDKDFKLGNREKILNLIGGKPHNIFLTEEEEMNKWNWREELLTQVHTNAKRSGIKWVLFPDEDEKLPLHFDFDTKEEGQFMFDYSMVADGTHTPYIYPDKPHAKIYTYNPYLTYNPYHHFARVGKDGKPYKEINTGYCVEHYCFYKKEWMMEKEASILKRYPNYFKTFKKRYK